MKIPDVTLGLMRHIARGIAYRAVRNRGTIGGSLAHADPAADWLATMIALDASVRLQSTPGVRQLKVADFVVGALDTQIAEAEVISQVLVPRLTASARWGHSKYAKKSGRLRRVLAAISIFDGERGLARVVLGRRAEPPALMQRTSEQLAADGAQAVRQRRGGGRSRLAQPRRETGRLDDASSDRDAGTSGYGDMRTVNIRVNGKLVSRPVEDRLSLADFVRDHCLLTGTHVGCEHGVCGACTLLMDGKPVRSCITLAAAADECDVRTVEGYRDDPLDAGDPYGIQSPACPACGFCTPGMLATAYDMLSRIPELDRDRIRIELGGNLCRCTGYLSIIQAIEDVHAQRVARAATPPSQG